MGTYRPLSKKEKINLFVPLLVALALAGGTWFGFVMSSRNHNKYRSSRSKLGEVMRLIDARYLEEEDLSKLEESALIPILQKLDPHSRYISLEDIEQSKSSLSGNFDGIGVEFYILEDTIFIVNVIDKGPSQKAGVLDGDKIITINDSLIAGQGIYNKDVMNMLKGKSGSAVTIGVKRQGKEQLKQITITRGKIPIKSIDVAYIIDQKTALIKINRFSATTYDEFLAVAKKLTEESDMQNLILDLRNNPGGYLDAAANILDQLFNSRKLLVYTEGRSYKRKEYNSTGKSQFNLNQIIILINESSASASEIIAGAVQDNDRGLIIGRRSYGKGLVQEEYMLSDGSALRLTVARYFTPSGRYIQKPYDKSEAEYNQDLKNRYDSGELYYEDSVKIEDSTEYRTNSGRIVYGGGGIMPDIFIPMDTLFRNHYYLTISSYLPPFVYHYIDWNRQKMVKMYPTFKDFDTKFKVTPAIFEQYLTFTESKGISRNTKALASCKKRIKHLMKSYLTRQLYSEENHYQVLHRQDEAIQRAIHEINRNQTLE